MLEICRGFNLISLLQCRIYLIPFLYIRINTMKNKKYDIVGTVLNHIEKS